MLPYTGLDRKQLNHINKKVQRLDIGDKSKRHEPDTGDVLNAGG